ncbi:MAG: sulfatase-like hydrolase/transferase [Deltaproteobacteria bacterium]|nr:sulfatase-like hydrolase/transferase [Deltaproteobacteria bacterium]MBI3386849.1 sulfatase-like hydrolase/transferase [Deltaproteobacteria bacterium]
MGRKILFITTDQQRYDALGCNGGTIARTPVVDRLAATGVNFRRAHNQNVVCMPARSTMITGQYVRTHGVFANGVALPADAPSVAAYLHEQAGYRTALLGKAHFEPAFDPKEKWFENRMAGEDSTGPFRGFEHMELAMHGPMGGWHYSRWLQQNHPDEVSGFAPLLSAQGGGDTNAPEVTYNPIAREHYHTDWVADRTIAYLDSLAPQEDWFVWMSFPDPHHPWDPPASEARRINWRDLDLPPGHPGSDETVRKILAQKPRHWLAWYEGKFRNNEGGPMTFVPSQLTHDQIREVNALTHVENELIDEACGRVLRRIAERGWDADTDIFFTTDHGEFQGDYGLLYKGPYHVNSLMHIPLIWRPAPSARVTPTEVAEPVGQLDLAPTFCGIAGVPVPAWMDGTALPTAPGSGRERVITEWDSQFAEVGMHLRTIYRDGFICTVYEPSTSDIGFSLERLYRTFGANLPLPDFHYDGSEGELYNVNDDPWQWRNLWSDTGYAKLKSDLIADLYYHLPKPRDPQLKVQAPA